MEFFPEVHISHEAADAMARALYAIARVDGVHEREEGLIASFWIEVGGGGGSLSDLNRQGNSSPQELAHVIHGENERMLFMKTAVLLTFADGKVTPEEEKALHEYAAALGISHEALGELQVQVKEYLLNHLAHLNNTDATTAVAKKLEV